MTAVLILGMGRSGTSCLAGSLQQQGVYLGKVFEWNPHNRKGNRENPEVMALNNSVLELNGGSWNDPPDKIQWTQEQAATRDRIISDFAMSGHEVWGFKDPRTLATYDFWIDGLRGLEVKPVGTFRNPLAVANSLLKRDKLPVQRGLALWEKYNRRMLELYAESRFPLVSFDVGTQEYQQSVQRILAELHLPYDNRVEDLFFDEGLRHEDGGEAISVPAPVLELYRSLCEIHVRQTRGMN